MNIESVVVHESREFLDVVDECDQLTGKKKLRIEIHRDGDWHREVHIFVYNGKGEILLQLRGPHQEMYPNCWDVSVGGHVSAGSNYLESALKELEEELGVKTRSEELQEYFYQLRDETVDAVRRVINRKHRKVYAYRFDGRAEDLKPEEGTITALKFFTKEEMMALPENYGEGISILPGYKPYYAMVFDKVNEILKNALMYS